ncbi:DUF1788 domain-containing protein [Lewinella cohaerens]|uniref:DUF1788 domain-containing protein n=1 Tax=Lewinella cohaerens TaxID=70995 RepID=UPI000368FE93|nr:DUF1788 domain-containing protein [Lewinella cohaerens]
MMEKVNLASKFSDLLAILQMQKFLRMEALGGEIPFFISTYAPQQELELVKAVHGLVNKLETKGIKVLEINLWQIVMDILERELGPSEIFSLEEQMDKDEFKQALQSVLDINEVLMPEIHQRIEQDQAQLYFVTGVGNVYPFLRSHNILNNLQNVAKDAPTVMFFPGRYTGQSLELFGLLKDDNYYRAFNLDNYKL